MELKMTPLVNGDVEDGGNSGKPSQSATIISDMKISFRDMVTGNLVIQQRDNFIEDFDVELSADDVVIGRSGSILEIRFADRVHLEIDEKHSKSVIVRLLGKSIGFRALRNCIKALWMPAGEVNIIDLDNEYFMVRFALQDDYDRVLVGGPWMVYRKALAGCEDSQHLNSGVNIQFATTIVSPIHNVSYAPNSTIATESNKQQSVADNMSGLSKVRLVIAKQSDARMENAHEAVALQ
ncbi:hypothetical protein V6N11_000818 [Hibiscus sabdariffa]|uniref:DUF4283 domain-containing protein n=1 Tax=Hibiscus sabdariffa TaxID=183260 RepID=A0ABR2RXV2_9ROSI